MHRRSDFNIFLFKLKLARQGTRHSTNDRQSIRVAIKTIKTSRAFICTKDAARRHEIKIHCDCMRAHIRPHPKPRHTCTQYQELSKLYRGRGRESERWSVCGRVDLVLWLHLLRHYLQFHGGVRAIDVIAARYSDRFVAFLSFCLSRNASFALEEIFLAHFTQHSCLVRRVQHVYRTPRIGNMGPTMGTMGYMCAPSGFNRHWNKNYAAHAKIIFFTPDPLRPLPSSLNSIHIVKPLACANSSAQPQSVGPSIAIFHHFSQKYLRRA